MKVSPMPDRSLPEKIRFPKVSIIILNWNGKKDTIECLESLKKISYPNYEISVVDNGSEGDDVEVLKELFKDHIYIIENDKNQGFAEGNNIGMRHALQKRSDYILLLNNDTYVDSEFLSKLIETAETNPNIGAVGPKILFYDEPDKIWFAGGRIDLWRCNTWHTGQGEIDNGQYNSLQEVDYITGCALLVKCRIVDKIGMLDPEYQSYYEDADWCLRAKRYGYKIIYVPEAKVWHKVGSSTGGGCSSFTNPFRAKRRGRNTFLFMRKNAQYRHWIVFPFFACIYLARAVIRETARGNTDAASALIKGIISNINLKLKE